MKTIEINIPINSFFLQGNLNIPDEAAALVIFSHGSGSSRYSVRNNYVAQLLNKEKIATLLTDLLTEKEDTIYENRFNIDLLTERLTAVTHYATELPLLQNLPVGYFGASTGAASALKAAAQLDTIIKAVVSRGGRPDLANSLLQKVKAATLLMVGSLDEEVIRLNEHAYSKLNCEKKMQIIHGATHLFEEPGKLDTVAHLAIDWFKNHLVNSKIKDYAFQG
jgi:putative phosphoribosyl transferase